MQGAGANESLQDSSTPLLTEQGVMSPRETKHIFRLMSDPEGHECSVYSGIIIMITTIVAGARSVTAPQVSAGWANIRYSQPRAAETSHWIENITPPPQTG
ncbi:MAG: hypothetical protein C4B59_01515 [Candidatus Methanogaster sp.]|uniref:Uncharacterized protein n=1 Tax=Candidatus Methanogaster sp. TaxID=3386292 RepID=A0AC61L682_9EURY|nr:MAG: hypothetical protein C4B59_01515 [ANME-2 cluster archaeon]